MLEVDAVLPANPFHCTRGKELLPGADAHLREMRHLLFEPTVESGVADACGRRKLGFISAFHGP